MDRWRGSICQVVSNSFLSAIQDQLARGPVILIFDGHQSHINLPLLKKDNDKGIYLLRLPPNTTHALQPLDVGFWPYEDPLEAITQNTPIETRVSRLDRSLFQQFMKIIYQEDANPEYLRSAFRRLGIYPLSEYAVPQWKIEQSSLPLRRCCSHCHESRQEARGGTNPFTESSQQEAPTDSEQDSQVSYTTTNVCQNIHKD